jgi:PKD repeat protein
LESNGTVDSSTENWTSTEESQVVSEITSGLEWLASQNLDAGVSFTLDVHYKVPTSYEPINRPSSDDVLWVGEAMSHLGYSGSFWFTQVRDYINALRSDLNTEWAFAIFVVDSSNDADGMFLDDYVAYAYLGGPFLVMTYDNDGYGIWNMDYVTAHETCHIFYATDEYNNREENSGYLNVTDNDGSGDMMELANTWWLCTNSKEQLGWRDTDGDGIQDIVDTFPNTFLNSYQPDPSLNTVLAYSGWVVEDPYPNNNPYGTGNDVTINTIKGVQFRIDSETWVDANASDGFFDEVSEDFNFTTPSLSSGTHLIEVRGINSVGNAETSFSSDSVTVPDFVPPTTVNNYDKLWHTTGFVINLTATDDFSGPAETYFKINDGTNKTVSTNGQPIITTEGANNTLEYWSVDKAGNEELPHKVLKEIKLDKTAPRANLDVAQTVHEDTLVTFDGSASTDENGIATYTWIFIDVTQQTFTNKSFTYIFATPGAYLINLIVTDPAGNYAIDTLTIKVLDMTKPVAKAGADQTGEEDTPTTFDGSASSDNVAITTYTWTFTDVTIRALTEEKPTYTFNTPGVYTITLNVTDATGNWATDTVTITVLDITKPIVNAGQTQTVNVGATVTFDASASSDNVGIVTYEWDFGDGTTGAGKTTTHIYTKPKTYMVTLTVKDAAGNIASHQITVKVLSPEALPTWLIVTVAAAIVIAIAVPATMFWKKREARLKKELRG